jgi:hypothetical protein
VAAHNSLVTTIDSGSGAGFIRLRSSADVLLAQIPLDDPCGTVNGTTGQLTLTMDGRDESANATGTVAYGEICDSDGDVHLSLPAQSGSTPVSGKLVMTTLSLIAGAPVEVLSATIG